MTQIGIRSEHFPFSGSDEHSTTPHISSQITVPALPPTNAKAADSPESSPSLSTNTRVGRQFEFTAEDDLILICKVFAARANVTPQGETRERFEVVASKANACRKLSFAVTKKSVQDRYKRLQARANEANKRDVLMSGIGGKVGEAVELLSAMREARNDIIKTREEKRRVAIECEAEKERLGKIFRVRAM